MMISFCVCWFVLKNNNHQELTAIKARVLEMEEESERLKEEDRCDAGDMQLLATSPRPGEITCGPGFSVSAPALALLFEEP